MAINKDPLSGFCYLSRVQKKKSDKAPDIKGFVNITPELLAALNEMDVDDYGTFKLEVSLWKKPDTNGVYTGSVSRPYSVWKEDEGVNDNVVPMKQKTKGQARVTKTTHRTKPQHPPGRPEADLVDVDDIPF